MVGAEWEKSSNLHRFHSEKQSQISAQRWGDCKAEAHSHTDINHTQAASSKIVIKPLWLSDLDVGRLRTTGGSPVRSGADRTGTPPTLHCFWASRFSATRQGVHTLDLLASKCSFTLCGRYLWKTSNHPLGLKKVVVDLTSGHLDSDVCWLIL